MYDRITTTAGRILADELVRHLMRTEAFQNLDECIDDVREAIGKYADEETKCPVSALLYAEDEQHLLKRKKEARYIVTAADFR